MFHIVYVSEASQAYNKQQLEDLHARSRAKNRIAGVTGMLIHKDDRFAQVLEGEEPVVRSLLDIIRRDSRHRHIDVLAEGPIAEREFSVWSMGFQDLNSGDLLGLYGHTKPLGKSVNIQNFKAKPEDCLHVLRFIRDLQLTRK